MDPTVLYYALSTIAQCAAALAVLIGFLGLWRLDRLKQEGERIQPEIEKWVNRQRASQLDVQYEVQHGSKNLDIMTDRRNRLIWKAREIVKQQKQLSQFGQQGQRMEAAVNRFESLPGEQRRLMCTLSRFLRRTLLILTLAIIGFVFANILYAWVLTRWIVWLLIIVASISLYQRTAAVVREAARSLQIGRLL